MAAADGSGADPIASAEAQRDRFRNASDAIRKRADLTAKSVGALGTTALTGVGLAKVGDLFPWPGTGWSVLALLALAVSFGTMAFVVGFFTWRLWQLSRPVVTQVETERMTDLSEDEKTRVRDDVYQPFAELNDAPSLRAYEARMHRLQRIADRSGGDRATELRRRAELMGAEIGGVLARGGMIVIRRRAADAIADKAAFRAYAALAAAIFGFIVAADWLESERTGELEVAVKCAEARGKDVEDLPEICGDDPAAAEDEDEPSPESTVADAVVALAKANAACIAAAETRGVEPAACAPIARAMRAAGEP